MSGLAVFIADYILAGVHIDTPLTALIVAIVMGIVNLLIKPVVLLLTLPINLITLGLFTLVINGLMVLLVTLIVPGFKVDNFGWAILFSLVVSVVGWFFQIITKK